MDQAYKATNGKETLPSVDSNTKLAKWKRIYLKSRTPKIKGRVFQRKWERKVGIQNRIWMLASRRSGVLNDQRPWMIIQTFTHQQRRLLPSPAENNDRPKLELLGAWESMCSECPLSLGEGKSFQSFVLDEEKKKTVEEMRQIQID